MLAAQLEKGEAESLIEHFPGVSIAALNSPTSVTFSGHRDGVDGIARELKSRGTWFKFLRVSHAFHSADMEPARGELQRSLRDLSPAVPQLPYVSAVTGQPLHDNSMDAEYWWRNVRQCVRFQEGIRWLLEQEFDVFLEVSPHPVLSGSIIQTATDSHRSVRVFPSLRRGDSERKTMLGSLGALFTLGRDVNWDSLYPSTEKAVPSFARISPSCSL